MGELDYSKALQEMFKELDQLNEGSVGFEEFLK